MGSGMRVGLCHAVGAKHHAFLWVSQNLRRIRLFLGWFTLGKGLLDLAESKQGFFFRHIRLVFIEALCQAFEEDKNHDGPQEQGTAGFHDGAS